MHFQSALIAVCLTILTSTVIGNMLTSEELLDEIDDFLIELKDSNSKEDSNDDHIFEDEEISVDKPSTTICGKTPITPCILQRIVGGKVARPYSWPWQVSVQTISDSFHFCGGTIIGLSKVVSAAHCFFDKVGNKFSLNNFHLVGGIHSVNDASNATSQAQTRRVIRLETHPSFNKTGGTSFNDIAVLILDTPFNFDEKVQPACLPSSPLRDINNCYTTGWWNVGENNANSDGKLRQLMVPIIPMAICRSWMNIIEVDSKICTGNEEGGKSACYGDSGGPLVCRSEEEWVLEGVVSQGAGCGKPMKAVVYTKVHTFRYWIDSIN